ncbi:MAG: hypothetical protein IPL19_09870 [Sandaracinaceae bacterium]|nr:hypothetical protein [Sandaracinaceae bacterium]MBK8408272.1 hypothetical protein [Sandaracinaceae bacterium]MBP7682448.1 hypothetical protein [Deltaproteobacteria bacterium]
MGYSYVFLGDLQFSSAEQKAAWRKTALDGTSFDSPKDWSHKKGATAAEALSYFTGELSLVEDGDTTLKLRAVVDKGGDEFLEARRPLVCAFRQAASFGGEGALTVVGYRDYPGVFGVRAAAAEGTSTCEELDDDEASAVENTDAYREADALVAAMVAKHQPPGGFEQVLKDIAAKREADGAVIASARDMDDVFDKLPTLLPPHAIYTVRDWLPSSPLVMALAARRDDDASARMLERLRRLAPKERHVEDDILTAYVLMHALWERGEARGEIMRIWIESPRWFLRDHERARKLGGREADVQLAALLGVWQDTESNAYVHHWIVDALFASDPENAAARAEPLLDGDRRAFPGRLESLRWIVMSFYDHPERRSPAWEDFFVRLTTTGPSWSDHPYDVHDQIRLNAMGVLALWKLPQALPLIRENFARLGVDRGVELLVALGDPAGLPVLETELANAKRKPDRTRLTKGIAALGGEPAPASEPVSHLIEVASSGRAGCRGCKQKIAKGELRFGEAAPNRFSDSDEPTMRWYHLRCAAEKRPKLLGPVLATYSGEVADRAALEASIAKAMKPKKRAEKEPR